MNIKNCIIALVSMSVFGCTQLRQNSATEECHAHILEDGDTVYSSNQLYIQDIDVRNDLLLLQISNEQAAFVLLNPTSSDVVATVNRGEGPDDIVFGRIMKTCAGTGRRDFMIYDNNIGKIITIRSSADSLITSRPNHRIIESRSLCFNDTLMAGHQMGSSAQLFIDTDGNDIRECDYYLTMSHDIKEKLREKYEHVMSNCFAVNPTKDRLLSFNYFFDCIVAYSLDGKFVSSNRRNNDATAECRQIIDDGNYWSYCHPYATNEACYIKAIRYINNEANAHYIHKLDWNGELLKSYRLPDNIYGGYAVTDDSRLYCIISEVKGDDEVFHIIKYNL